MGSKSRKAVLAVMVGALGAMALGGVAEARIAGDDQAYRVKFHDEATFVQTIVKGGIMYVYIPTSSGGFWKQVPSSWWK